MLPAVRDANITRRLWLTVAINVIYVLVIKWHPAPPLLFKGVLDVMGIAIGLLGGWWGLQGFRAKGRSRRLGRQSWGANLVAMGVLAYALGMVTWFYYEILLKHHDVPFPSWADAYFLASYPLLMLGVLMMPTRPIPQGLRGRVLLDCLMMMTGLVTFSWYFILGPTVLQGSETLLGRVLGVGYPLGDLAVLFCLLVISAHPAEAAMRPSRQMLICGILAYVMSDSVFGYMTLKGTYTTGQFLDVGWTLGNLLIGLGVASYRQALSAASSQEADFTQIQRNPVLWRAVLPYAFLPAVGILIFYMLHHTGDEKLESGVYIGSAVLITLVVLRQVLALLENNRLYRRLQDAYREQELDRRSLAESNVQLKTLATTDGMTGLPNHRAFQERLRQELDLVDRSKGSLSLMLLDVDRFKQYNDCFGHPAGDEALRIVARLLRENLHDGDFPARYGGEEFAVILPGSDMNAAATMAERVRSVVEGHLFHHRRITLSIGLAAFTRGEGAETLIKHADAALYVAKHEGRNCVRLIEPSASRASSSSDIVYPALSEQAASTVSGLLAALHLRDSETKEHSERVARYSVRLAEAAEQLGLIALNAEMKQTLLLGALLHDVGKIGTPDAILHKPGRLEPMEWARMREHPQQGVHIVHRVPCLAAAIPVVLHHHEYWDGSGYPDGLAHEQIPVEARLFAIADALDAMTSDRPYRKALSFVAAREEVTRMAGTQFDPTLVQAFLAVPAEAWQRLCGNEMPSAPFLKAA